MKKKFVLSTDYCLTLDRVPEEFYSEITENITQIEEWKNLFAINEIDTKLVDVDFLKENPNLVLDTGNFDLNFKDRLLSYFDNLDNDTGGLLIHGDNFQGVNLLKRKYRETIKTIYIDPPYNTKGSGFLYKDEYKHSSWLSLAAARISISHDILLPDGIISISIDDNEMHHLRMLLNEIFCADNFVTQFVWNKKNVVQNDAKFASVNHEYIVCYRKSNHFQKFNLLPRSEKANLRYKNPDNDPRGPWQSVALQAKSGTSEDVYTVTFPNGVTWTPPSGTFPKFPKDSLLSLYREGFLYFGKEGRNVPRLKKFLTEVMPGMVSNSILTPDEVGSTQSATEALKNMMGASVFNSPKAVGLIQHILVLSTGPDDIILDYFAGSGTTAHATLDLNRQDSGKRKYILIEVGHYFENVLKPRVKKAIYAEKWKKGKPVSHDSRLSHMFKYQHIESYEDALNNIEFNETKHKELLLGEHQLRYMLESDTRESPTFLNISELKNPFSYQLEIVKDMQKQKQDIDLPETFNYLIGLSVQTRRCLKDGEKRYLVYRGTEKEKTVVIIWRETEGWREQDYERDYQFIQEQELTSGATKVYVNTSSNIPGSESLDPHFKRLMFSK